MQTILVTGAGGYIGSHAVKALLRAGHKVIAFDNFSRGYREPLKILSKYGKLEIIEGDLKQKEDLRKIFEEYAIDGVMHFAALCSVGESIKTPEIYFENNVFGTVNLLEAMERAKVKKLIFSSTCAVYGKAEHLPVTEETATVPTHPYGESKLMAEKMIALFSNLHDIHYVILRYFNVCGADSEGEIGDSKRPSEILVSNVVRSALGIEDFKATYPVVSTKDGSPVRDYIDVEDIVEAHILAYKYLDQGKPSEIFNIGTGKGSSVLDIINVVKEEVGVDIPIKKGSEREGEIGEIYGDVAKAKKILNFAPKKTLKDSAKSLVKWYNNYPNGYKK